MEISLEASNPLPLYQQLVEQLRRQILLGALEAGEKLPTVRELAVQARVNRNTAARAVQALEAAGLVHTRVGRGTFVADEARERGAAALEAALDELLDRTIEQARQLGADPATLPGRLQTRLESALLAEDPGGPESAEEDPR